MTVTHFMVRRDNLRHCRYVDEPAPAPLQNGELRLSIDRFALTANNITYATFGEAMAYWAFFPAPPGWGRIPVWGYADVIESRHPAVPEGERLFGYLPMSTHLTIQPDKVGIVRLTEGSPHRRKLPGAYQSYTRTSGDSWHRPEFEDHLCVFKPLFATSYLIEDFLAEQQLFGARRVILSSASSKTALGLAHRLERQRAAGVEVVGLSSPANLAFCAGTGYYDNLLAYEALEQLPADIPSVFVDMAGNGRVLHDLHHRLGAQLKHSCMVGGTHWEQRETQHALPGAKPVFFFAPTQFAKRGKDWGAAGLESRIAEALQAFIASAQPWLNIQIGQGRDAIEGVYRRLLEGHLQPEQAHVLRF